MKKNLFSFSGYWITLLLILFLSACNDCKNKPEIDETLFTGSLIVNNFAEHIGEGDYTVVLKNAKSGEIVSIPGKVLYASKEDISINISIKCGEYRLLKLTLGKDQGAQVKSSRLRGVTEIPMGFRFKLNNQYGIIPAETVPHDANLMCDGNGTEEFPFRITTGTNLYLLAQLINTTVNPEHKQEGTETGYAYKYFVQEMDIDLSEVCQLHVNQAWEPIGKDIANAFSGYYDGGGCYIDGLTVKNYSDNTRLSAGLFGYTYNVRIENVKMRNVNINGGTNISGALIGSVVAIGGKRMSAELKSCSVESGTVEGGLYVGGLVGGSDEATVLMLNNCYNRANVKGTGYATGGLVGATVTGGALWADQCSNSGRIEGQNGTGGISGVADTVLITSCKNTGTINAEKYKSIGGILGVGRNGSIVDCHNEGSINGTKLVGGLLGSTQIKEDEEKVYGSIMVGNCTNKGKISAVSYAGGIVGVAQSSIHQCINSGAVIARDSTAGGIIGGSPYAVITSSANEGEVSCQYGGVGGIAGYITELSINYCINNGKIRSTADASTGGIIGGSGLCGMMSYCYNFNEVSSTGGYVGGIAGALGYHKDQKTKMQEELGSIVFSTLWNAVAVGLSTTKFKHKKRQEVDFLYGIALHNYSFTTLGLSVLGSLPTLINPTDLEKHVPDLVASTSPAIKSNQQAITNKVLSSLSSIPGLTSTQTRTFVETMCSHMTHEAEKIETNSTDFNDCFNNKINYQIKEAEKQERINEVVVSAVSCVLAVVNFSLIKRVGLTANKSVILGIGSGFVDRGTGMLLDNEPNAISATQIYNLGKVTAEKSKRGGGLVGQLGDLATITNSITCNPTMISNDPAAVFVGTIGNQSSLQFCIDMSGTSKYVIEENDSYSGIKVYSIDSALQGSSYNNTVLHSFEELTNPDFYAEYDRKIWTLTPKQIPTFYNSELYNYPL